MKALNNGWYKHFPPRTYKFIKDNLFVFFFVLVCAIYYAFRPTLLILFIATTFLLFLIYSLLKNFRLPKHFVITISLLFILFYIFMSLVNYRPLSMDGLITHLRNTFLLKSDFYISYLDQPLKPYLAEMFLAFLWRFSSVYLLNVSFAAATLIAILLTLELYKKLDLDNSFRYLALFILVTSPTFLLFAFIEFKIDMFLLIFSLLAYLQFIRTLEKPNLIRCVVLGFILSINCLIKTTFIPSAAIIIMLLIFDKLFTNAKQNLKLTYIFAVVISFLIPLLIWAYLFGFSIPRVSGYINGKLNKVVPIHLYRDSIVYKECFDQRVRNDYSEFLYGNGFLGNLLQPIYYLANYKSPFLTFHIGNPGFLIYFSFFLFVFLPLFNRNLFKNKRFVYFYIFVIINLVIFYATVRKIYWYLFYIYPFVSLTVPVIIAKLCSEWGAQKRIINSLVFATGILNLIIAIAMFVQSVLVPYKVELYMRGVYGLSSYINSLKPTALIMNASEHKWFVPITFVKDADKRVIKSDFYFVSSQKSSKEMYKELKSNNIDYLVVFKNKLADSWYNGCPLQNNIRLKEFIDSYTIPLYYLGGSPVVFELK